MRLKKAITAAIALLHKAQKAKSNATTRKDVQKAIAALERGLGFAVDDGGSDILP